MTRRLWIADRATADRAYLTGQNAAHLARVLRARPGQQFDIAVQGAARIGTVISVSEGQVEFELGGPLASAPVPEISIVLSIYKFDRLEWAVEKLTELGVTRILPAIARRTEPHLAKAAEKRVERWRKIAREAAQQSRRPAPPEIMPPAPLKKAIQHTSGCRIVLSEVEEQVMLKSALGHCSPPVLLALGPEGGWTAEELEMFRENGWIAASMGNTVLRAETAAIAAMAVVVAELS